VKQGKVNASLPEGTTADTITLEQAVELLAAKASSGKGSSRARTTRTAAPKVSGAKTPKPASKASGSAKQAKPATKPPVTTKTGRLRASAVRVIKPAGS
jgi:DNA topoisomerase-1